MELIIDKKSANGTNKYSLLQSQSKDITDAYAKVFAKVEGSLTTVADNDATTKFNVAFNSLHPTESQIEVLNNLQSSFKDIEKIIDPVRLNFEIVKALDGEICLNRISELGVSKIIIHEDGLIARSFIAFKNVEKEDILDFFENDVDYETITFNFFS